MAGIAPQPGPVRAGPARAGSVRATVGLTGHLGRALLREARREVRQIRNPHRWWLLALRSPCGIELRPATLNDAQAWARLIRRAGSRPPSAGPAASSLGGAARTPVEWRTRCFELRNAARRGLAFPYLAYLDGDLVGEVVGYADPGTRTVTCVVWIEPGRRTSLRWAASFDLLAQHVLAGDDPARRVVTVVPAEHADELRAASALPLQREGELNDPIAGRLAALVLTGDGADDA